MFYIDSIKNLQIVRFPPVLPGFFYPKITKMGKSALKKPGVEILSALCYTIPGDFL